jgi:hypothetical protein
MPSSILAGRLFLLRFWEKDSDGWDALEDFLFVFGLGVNEGNKQVDEFYCGLILGKKGKHVQ